MGVLSIPSLKGYQKCEGKKAKRALMRCSGSVSRHIAVSCGGETKEVERGGAIRVVFCLTVIHC